MQAEEGVLQRSIKCQVPTFPQEERVLREVKAERLSDHILACTLLRAEVAELRAGILAQLRDARKEWRDLQGWEPHLRRRSDRSKEAEFEAKRQLRPELAERIELGEFSVERCEEEMDRLDKDATRCNQAWQMIAKG